MATDIPDSFPPNFKSQSELQCFTNSSEDAAEEKGYQKKGAKRRKLIPSPTFLGQ